MATRTSRRARQQFKRLPKGPNGGIQLLLIQSVDHLGKQGEVVEVKPGYANNYLLPQGLATLASVLVAWVGLLSVALVLESSLSLSSVALVVLMAAFSIRSTALRSTIARFFEGSLAPADLGTASSCASAVEFEAVEVALALAPEAS